MYNFPSLFSTLCHAHSSQMLHVDASRRWLVAWFSHLLLFLPPLVSADAQCKTTAKADIVLLVDGSWSIGRLNFKTIRTFITRMITVFDISPDKVQIGNVSSAAKPTVGSVIELSS